MRQLKYLSPTSLSLWLENQEEFYLRYLAFDRPDKIPQTPAMSVGSAFDAYVKSWLSAALQPTLGGSEFELDTIFDKQVEPQNRAFGREAGKHCFDAYKNSGALASILLLLNNVDDVRFEFTVEGKVERESEGHGYLGLISESGLSPGLSPGFCPRSVPLLGKPDLRFRLGDRFITLDWKVNGYCSRTGVSPRKGYTKIYNTDGTMGGCHKDCILSGQGEPQLLHNVGMYLEDVDISWARQLTTYNWLSGSPVGQYDIVMIHQLACRAAPSGPPRIRVAEHVCSISSDFQHKTFLSYKELWDIIHSDHIFRSLTQAESEARCVILDQQAAALRGDLDQNQKWLNQMLRSGL